MPTLAAPAAVSSRDPWFRRHPQLALIVIGALFLAVLTLRLLAGRPADAYSMLYFLPVALAATAFGQRAGVAAGLLAVALIVVWAVTRDVGLGPLAWATRAIPTCSSGSSSAAPSTAPVRPTPSVAG